MDPDETLALLREVARDVDIHGFDHSGRNPIDAALQLATLVNALDGWLSTGGFLPQAWAVQRGARA